MSGKVESKVRETWVQLSCAGCGKRLRPHLTRPGAKIYCSECCCPMCVQERKLVASAGEPAAQTNLSQQDYDNLVRDAMLWRKARATAAPASTPILTSVEQLAREGLIEAGNALAA